MFKCFDKVVGELIQSEDLEVLKDVCAERMCDYGSRADFYQVSEKNYEITYLS